jgi:hypothetical protein
MFAHAENFTIQGGDFSITGGTFTTIQGGQFRTADHLNIHFDNEDSYTSEELPSRIEVVPHAFIPEGAAPITGNNINSNNVTGNRVKNIQNQSLDLHLHYSESTYGTLLQPSTILQRLLMINVL